MNDLFAALCSKTKLERDRGVLSFKELLHTPDVILDDIQNQILSVLQLEVDKPWETLIGGLLASKEFFCVATDGIIQFPSFEKSLMLLLDHDESRVRLSAGEVFGLLCSKGGVAVYGRSKEVIISKIMENFDRRSQSIGGTEGDISPRTSLMQFDSHEVFEHRASALDIFHDTAGWKHLETWIKCLQYVIQACGASFAPFVDGQLLRLISRSLDHQNRFVRETGHYVCGCLSGCSAEEAYLQQYGHLFASNIAKGLSDNWSQVRMAASVASRQFLFHIEDAEKREPYYPILLPPLCLNRYYIAEGVRVYSQTTWQKLFGEEGRLQVEKHIADVVPFYIGQTTADNHAVREAACACIAELGSKIDKTVMSGHIEPLLTALIVCFHDDSWPVRDSACVACGNFVLAFPDESKASLSQLYPLFFENLSDSIQSVRQGAARSLGNVVKAYGDEAFVPVIEKMDGGLNGIDDQPTQSTERLSPVEKEPAQFGVIKRIPGHVTDAAHTDKQMYSCGSLAPKMHAAGSQIGDGADHLFKKPFQPWFLADGCVWLFGELAEIKTYAVKMAGRLHLLAKITSKKDYEDHVYLLESVFKELPVIARAVGKQPFKPQLELFYDAIFYGLRCDNALAEAAAADCLIRLGQFIGPNILRGRVEMYNPAYLDQLEPIIFGHRVLP